MGEADFGQFCGADSKGAGDHAFVFLKKFTRFEDSIQTSFLASNDVYDTISFIRERRFGKMSQINSGESLDTADDFSPSEKEKEKKPKEPERRLTLKERQARRSRMFKISCNLELACFIFQLI